MTRLVAGLIAALALAGVAKAQDWQRIGPEGGVVHAIEVPDPVGQRAYAVSTGGLFRSDDRGATWRLMPSPDPERPTRLFTLRGFSRSNPDAVALGHDQGVWRSTDGGQTWRELIPALPDALLSRFTALAVDPDDARRIAVFVVAGYEYQGQSGTYSALWLTEDGEQPALFEATVNRDPQCRDIVRNGLDHVNAAAFESGELYYGHLYTCSEPVGNPGLPAFYLMRWDHPMYHWFQSPYPPSQGQTFPGRLSAADGMLYLSLGSGPLYRLDADSNSLTEVRDSAPSQEVAGDGSVIVGGSRGLFRSTDQGQSWQRMDDDTPSVPGFVTQMGPAAVFSSPTRWLVGGIDGIYRSADADGPWQPSQRGFTGFPARTVAIDPDNEQRVWAGSMESRRVLMRTANGGDSWHTSDLGARATSLRSIVVDPATTANSAGTVVYATGLGCINTIICPEDVRDLSGIFRSRDSGATWDSISGDLPVELRSIALRSLALVPGIGAAQPGLLVTGHHLFSGIVVRSGNGGHTWTAPAAGLPAHGEVQSHSDVLDVVTAASNPQRVYLATVGIRFGGSGTDEVQRNGVFRSDDGGLTWTHRSSGLPLRPGTSSHTGVLRLAGHPANPDMIWAIAYDDFVDEPPSVTYKVYRSQDGGVTWNRRSTGLDGEQLLAIAVDPDNPQRVYVGGTHGVFHTVDGGTDWQRLGSATIGPVTGLVAGPRHLFAASELGVQKILKPGQSVGPEPCPESPPGTIRRHLDPHCSGRLWMPPR